jgi:hypothetical protein
VKGETVHAIFAEIEQQRAKHDHDGLQRHGPEQPGQHFGRHAQQQRGDTAMTNEYEKHPPLPFCYRFRPLRQFERRCLVKSKKARCLLPLYPMRFSPPARWVPQIPVFGAAPDPGPRSTVS